MSIEWIVENGLSGEPDICHQRECIISDISPDPIAKLKKGNVIIAVYHGLDNVKDEDVIEHVKTYYKEHGELELYMLNSDKFYTIS